MRASLQTVISHNFLCVQNPASHAAKSGAVTERFSWEKIQVHWAASALHLLWAWSALYDFLKTNPSGKDLLISALPQPLHPQFPSHHFPSHFPYLVFSDLYQGGHEEEWGPCCAPLPLRTCLHWNSWTFLLQHIFFLKILKIPTLLPSSQCQKGFSLYLHYLLFQLPSKTKVNIREYSLSGKPLAQSRGISCLWARPTMEYLAQCLLLEQDGTSTLWLSATITVLWCPWTQLLSRLEPLHHWVVLTSVLPAN